MKPDKRPKRTDGFSWGRKDLGNACTVYNLFRRDHRGAMHLYAVAASSEQPRAMTAMHLRQAKRLLRDRVDEIDLAAMEATT